jgi:hypothetical protein
MTRGLRIIGMIAAISLLPLAGSAQEAPATAESAHPMMGGHMMPGQMMGAGEEHGRGGWHHHGGGFGGVPPANMCKEAFARRAGFQAYLGAKLDLTAQQQPLWDAFQQATMKSAANWRQVCLDNSAVPQDGLTALERRDRTEKLLSARLDGLRATRPPLEALYQSLTPEQRALIDRTRGPGSMPGR